MKSYFCDNCDIPVEEATCEFCGSQARELKDDECIECGHKLEECTCSGSYPVKQCPHCGSYNTIEDGYFHSYYCDDCGKYFDD